MSNSNSSREVTEKKKRKNVWEEAGEEFYQESYPSGSGQADAESNGVIPKASRSNFPLPSHTARKNSFGFHNRRRSTFGRTATATIQTNNTNAFTTYNSTNHLPPHEVNVAALPDFAEMTIPNERKRWLELHRIKSMPINMNAKKELKTQLTTIPMLKLKGTKRLKWNLQRLKDKVTLGWRHWRRAHFLWHRSLRDIEDHSGTCVARILVSIKCTLYFNFLLFMCMLIFIILPSLELEQQFGGNNSTCHLYSSSKTRTTNSENESGELIHRLLGIDSTTESEADDNSRKRQMASCCTEDYSNEIENSRQEYEEGDWNLLFRALNMSTQGMGFPLFLTYGYHGSTKLKLPHVLGGTDYDLPLAYLLFPVLFFIFSLLTVAWQIRSAIKEVALAREGEFYKYSNLVFAGWDHYTKTLAGGNFRKRILKHEMQVALETEHLKVASESRKERWLTYTKRYITNIVVLILLGGIGGLNFLIADFSLRNQDCIRSNCTIETNEFLSNRNPRRLLIQFLPAVSIALCNFFVLFILRQIGRSEGHLHETEKALLLTRALVGRLLTVGCVGAKYYQTLYCRKTEDTCRLCTDSALGEKDPCWEAAFGVEILIILVVDIVFQFLLTLVFGYGRLLIGKILPCKVIANQNFCTTRHSLDVLYIQSISSFFYFSPFLPLLVIVHCLFVFNLKKFSLIVLGKGVSETVRTSRSKAVYVTVRLIALNTVALGLGLVLFDMEPSKGCGPFRTNRIPWQVVTDLDHRAATDAASLLLSPGILIPLLLLITVMSYFYYSSAKANRRMVETLKHMLVLEGHDKQYLFARLNTVPEGMENGTILERSSGLEEEANHLAAPKN